MGIEQAVVDRVQQLIAESAALSKGNVNDQCVDVQQLAGCSAWLTSAQNIVHIAIHRPDAPYRRKVDEIAEAKKGFKVHYAVAEMAAVLSGLLLDAQAGLLATVASQARAEVFDDFLDQADHYAKSQRKHEAGTIAGVVFEDSLRSLCRKIGIVEKGQKLDTLISELVSRDEFRIG